MAVAAWKQCFQFCGYLCGALAALNIWFWIGMTTFQYMGSPYISSEILLIENAIVEYKSDKAKDFVLVFAICIALNIACMIGCCWCTKCQCYQDKDAIVYYVGGGARVADFDSNANRGVGNLNGSEDGAGFQQRMAPQTNGGDGRLIR